MATRSEQEAKVLTVVSAFEGSGYDQVTGNIDRMGWSVGILQWNWGMGTLGPLFKAMHDEGPKTFARCLTVNLRGTTYQLAEHLLAACAMSPKAAAKWAAERTFGRNNAYVVEPWGAALKQLLAEPGFQAVQRHFAQPYLADARDDARYYQLETLRGLLLFTNIAVQSGQGKVGQNARQDTKAEFERLGGMKLAAPDRMVAIASAVANTCKPEWKQDSLSRTMTIIRGTGNVHGRAYNLGAKYGITDEPLA